MDRICVFVGDSVTGRQIMALSPLPNNQSCLYSNKLLTISATIMHNAMGGGTHSQMIDFQFRCKLNDTHTHLSSRSEKCRFVYTAHTWHIVMRTNHYEAEQTLFECQYRIIDNLERGAFCCWGTLMRRWWWWPYNANIIL